MNVRPLTRDEVRGIDARAAAEFRIPTLLLMENAGRGAAQVILDRDGGEPGRVVIACGPGNNGGDGAVVARHLDAAGWSVRVAWFADPAQLRGDAAAQRTILDAAAFDQVVIDPDAPADQFDALWTDADWLVDGLLGTGLARPVAGLMARAIDSLNRSGRPILALDLPSGLDADRGRPLGAAVRARVTATFVAPKVGFAQPEARPFLGDVVVVPIGVPRRVLTSFGDGPESAANPAR